MHIKYPQNGKQEEIRATKKKRKRDAIWVCGRKRVREKQPKWCRDQARDNLDSLNKASVCVCVCVCVCVDIQVFDLVLCWVNMPHHYCRTQMLHFSEEPLSNLSVTCALRTLLQNTKLNTDTSWMSANMSRPALCVHTCVFTCDYIVHQSQKRVRKTANGWRGSRCTFFGFRKNIWGNKKITSWYHLFTWL